MHKLHWSPKGHSELAESVAGCVGNAFDEILSRASTPSDDPVLYVVRSDDVAVSVGPPS